MPTDGAWQIAPLARDSQALTADRVACFGFDGNVQTGLGTVHHLNVLGQPETARFITRALAGEPQGLTPLDLSQPRKSRQIWRGRAAPPARYFRSPLPRRLRYARHFRADRPRRRPLPR